MEDDCGFPREGFAEAEIAVLEMEIKQFKKDANALGGAYQKSDFKANKFHLLDHAPEYLRRLGAFY